MAARIRIIGIPATDLLNPRRIEAGACGPVSLLIRGNRTEGKSAPGDGEHRVARVVERSLDSQ